MISSNNNNSGAVILSALLSSNIFIYGCLWAATDGWFVFDSSGSNRQDVVSVMVKTREVAHPWNLIGHFWCPPGRFRWWKVLDCLYRRWITEWAFWVGWGPLDQRLCMNSLSTVIVGKSIRWLQRDPKWPQRDMFFVWMSCSYEVGLHVSSCLFGINLLHW